MPPLITVLPATAMLRLFRNKDGNTIFKWQYYLAARVIKHSPPTSMILQILIVFKQSGSASHRRPPQQLARWATNSKHEQARNYCTPNNTPCMYSKKNSPVP